MVRVEGRGEIRPPKLGKVTSRAQTKELPTKTRNDPQTLVGLIWRVIQDPTRVVMLIVLLAAVAVVLSVLLTVMAGVHVSVAGSVSCGVLLVSIVLRRVQHRR